MWRPPIPINFITLHYVWIIFCSLLGLVVLYPYGNISAIDAFFFGASASTESGLNSVDLKDLKTYQQLFVYFIPLITNVGFINAVVVAVRLFWFEKRLKNADPRPTTPEETKKVEATTEEADLPQLKPVSRVNTGNRITFAKDANEPPTSPRALYIPSPRDRDRGKSISIFGYDDEIKPVRSPEGGGPSGMVRRRPFRQDSGSLSMARSVERAATSMFVLGSIAQIPERRPTSRSISRARSADLPYLSKEVTVGRNSQFNNLTAEDRERLGGIEYRALKLLLKVVFGYFFGLHILGTICLVPWIHNAPKKYTDYLAECGLNESWWAFYSAQTMANNLGFTLTPDSMISFRDATWPMLIMTFLAFAGNTCYPIFLRLIIWTAAKTVPRESSTRETLQFLLDHPRRCYTMLFPSGPTKILFGIIFVLNFIDLLLIILLDLDNPEVNGLAVGPRILAALFQAASARHTGTATFNLALVNPGVQFSLLVMMYIAVLPIAISIRASNTYEEKTLGIYRDQKEALDESDGKSYLMTHVRNQFSFDLWYIFLGTFCICIAEASRIMDATDPAFAVFPVFFEVVSAYGNVGLSLGHPTVLTSFSGLFTPFSKVVICAMMIRGRHRGLPYALDRAIMLPSERHVAAAGDGEESEPRRSVSRGRRHNPEGTVQMFSRSSRRKTG
ncbi:potassium transporter [Plectosphaerella plurivora]|uniref:Potassium transporter n=1 Tax=Plectosphaerella plurivora TaxID=936078 RepID=A0A9P9A7A0_9PEZI|nr:potassium transporter [Plectosphaerella plurivora]